jgi:cell wall-associated NlpC family hydrolase
VQRVPRMLAALSLAGTLLVGRSPSAQAQQLRAPTGWTIAQTALAYTGYRYAYVGDLPWTGFSCVGFVNWVYRQYGIWIPESVAIIAYLYPYIAPNNLQPGDLLLFTNTVFAGWSHVAIYIGRGLMIGADNFVVGVHVDSIWDSYWYSHWTRSVRVLSY